MGIGIKGAYTHSFIKVIKALWLKTYGFLRYNYDFICYPRFLTRRIYIRLSLVSREFLL